MTEFGDRIWPVNRTSRASSNEISFGVLAADPERAALWRDLPDRMWLYDGHVPL